MARGGIHWSGSRSSGAVAARNSLATSDYGSVSHQIPTKNERGRALAGLIIAFPASDIAEACPPIKPACRLVVLVHFEEDRARAEAGEPAQMQIEQLPRQSLAAARAGDGDRKDLGFLERRSRDMMNPTSRVRAMARCATMCRSRSRCSNSPSLHPRWNEAAWSVAIARGVARRGFRQRGLAAANRRVTISIIGEGGAPHPAAARRARAE